ncbi:MAG TPA: ABC transporter permease, partial [Candidatus Ligilactobacillus excrementipullorum]|nr:ABC transporter permease [Candidatus Ligilactobacillus excrementipullorum]
MKYKIKSNKLKDVIVIAFFALLAYMYIVILFKSGKIFPAADRLFHIERFEEEFKTFQNGHLVSMISTFSFSKVGQAINVYYPWGNLIPYGIIRSIVNKPVTAYYFYIGLEQFLGLLIAYFSANKISESRKLAVVFAIVLRFSAYVLFNDFPRFDIGESWALIFIPLTLAGFYNLVVKNNYLIGSGCMALGLSAELYCHILTSLITVVTLIALYVISFLFQSHKVKIVFSLICSVIIFLVLTSGFIIPLIFSMFQNKVIAPVIGSDESFNGYLAKSRSLSQIVNLSLDNHISGLEPNIGLVLLVTVFLGIVVFN